MHAQAATRVQQRRHKCSKGAKHRAVCIVWFAPPQTEATPHGFACRCTALHQPTWRPCVTWRNSARYAFICRWKAAIWVPVWAAMQRAKRIAWASVPLARNTLHLPKRLWLLLPACDTGVWSARRRRQVWLRNGSAGADAGSCHRGTCACPCWAHHCAAATHQRRAAWPTAHPASSDSCFTGSTAAAAPGNGHVCCHTCNCAAAHTRCLKCLLAGL